MINIITFGEICFACIFEGPLSLKVRTSILSQTAILFALLGTSILLAIWWVAIGNLGLWTFSADLISISNSSSSLTTLRSVYHELYDRVIFLYDSLSIDYCVSADRENKDTCKYKVLIVTSISLANVELIHVEHLMF